MDLQPISDAVAAGVVERRHQCLRVDVEGERLSRTELDCGECEHTGAAAVVDHHAGGRRMCIEVLETEPRGRMRAGAEGEAGIELDDDGVRLVDPHVRGLDPQPLAELHRFEVAQPFALPDLFLYGPQLQPFGVTADLGCEEQQLCGGERLGFEDRFEARGRP